MKALEFVASLFLVSCLVAGSFYVGALSGAQGVRRCVAEARTLDDDEAIPGQGYASGFAKHVENQCLSLE